MKIRKIMSQTCRVVPGLKLAPWAKAQKVGKCQLCYYIKCYVSLFIHCYFIFNFFWRFVFITCCNTPHPFHSLPYNATFFCVFLGRSWSSLGSESAFALKHQILEQLICTKYQVFSLELKRAVPFQSIDHWKLLWDIQTSSDIEHAHTQPCLFWVSTGQRTLRSAFVRQ